MGILWKIAIFAYWKKENWLYFGAFLVQKKSNIRQHAQKVQNFHGGYFESQRRSW